MAGIWSVSVVPGILGLPVVRIRTRTWPALIVRSLVLVVAMLHIVRWILVLLRTEIFSQGRGSTESQGQDEKGKKQSRSHGNSPLVC